MSLRDGRLRLHKPGDSIGVTYEHNQVLQLVKSRSKEQRLGIQLEGQNRNNYLFNSMQVCEGESMWGGGLRVEGGEWEIRNCILG